MPNAVSSRALLAIIEESAFGDTLSSTTFNRMRITSEALGLQPVRQHSGEQVGDRNKRAMQDLASSGAGPTSFELSYTGFEALLRAAICAGNGTADTPAAGTTRYINGNTVKSYYLEKQFLDIGAFVGVRGAVINELQLTFSANNPVTGQFGWLSKSVTSEDASRGVSVAAEPSDAVMRSGADVASIEVNGSALAAAIQSLSLTFRNNMTPEAKLTSPNPGAFQPHSFVAQGSMTAYFPSKSLFVDMLANTAKSLRVKVANAAGEIGIFLPAFRIVDGTPPISGGDNDVMVEFQIMAEYGGSENPFTAAFELKPAA